MNEPKSITFETRYGNIAGLQWGSGNKHQVLALHGWLDNAASFWHLAPRLTSEDMEITAIDFPGHGHSDHRAPGHIYGFIDYVTDIQAVIEQLTQPISLLCHSMGAAIGNMYATAFPEQIKQVILLENIGPLPPYQPGQAVESLRDALQKWKNHSLQHKRFYANLEQAIKARQEATPMPTEIIRPMVERGICITPQGLHWRTDKRLRLRSFFRLAEAQIQEFLAATSVPTQLIIGEPRTQALQYPMFEDRLAALNPNEYLQLKGGHHLHMTHADKVAAAIIPFMARHQ